MCAYSMIVDHKIHEWQDRLRPKLPVPPFLPTPQPPQITKEEVEEFRRLLERAREYDQRTNQPDCEDGDKKRALKLIADKLGVDISFV